MKYKVFEMITGFSLHLYYTTEVPMNGSIYTFYHFFCSAEQTLKKNFLGFTIVKNES